MSRKKQPAVVVDDQSFWVCRACGEEVLWSDGLWRLKGVPRQLGNWICREKVVPNKFASLYGAPLEPVFNDTTVDLRPGEKNYYHDGQEIDPIADLQRIVSEL